MNRDNKTSGRYVVYKTCDHGQPLKTFEGKDKEAFQAAKKYAMSLPYWGAGIYDNQWRHAFIGWVNPKGNFVPIGRRGA